VINGLQLTLQHVAIGVVGDGEEMRRHFVAPLALVQRDHVLIIDRQAPVRIDGDAEQSRVRLNIHTSTFSVPDGPEK